MQVGSKLALLVQGMVSGIIMLSKSGSITLIRHKAPKVFENSYPDVSIALSQTMTGKIAAPAFMSLSTGVVGK